LSHANIQPQACICEGCMHANTYSCVSRIPASPNNLLKEGKRTDVQQTSAGLLNALLEILRDSRDACAVWTPRREEQKALQQDKVSWFWLGCWRIFDKVKVLPSCSIQAQYSVDYSTEMKGLPFPLWPDSSQGW